jgi:hypothetical protein
VKPLVQPRAGDFYSALYGSTQKEIEKNILSIEFLNFKVRVNKSIEEPLKRVEKEIQDLSKIDEETRVFLKEIGSASSYVYRNVAGTSSMSLHSFGISIDLVPKPNIKKQVYWRWTANWNKEWFNTPFKDRWMIPPQVVQIFEKNGFVWGGKWLYFDTIHFDYSPELLEIYRYIEKISNI